MLVYFKIRYDFHAGIQRGGGGRGSVETLKITKNKGFLKNTAPVPPKNHKATKPAFNVWPSSETKRFADGPIMARL